MDDGADTEDESAAVVEVGRDGEEARLSEPIGLVAEVLAHASGVVKDDDARYAAGGGRSRQVGRHLAAGGGDEDAWHWGASGSNTGLPILSWISAPTPLSGSGSRNPAPGQSWQPLQAA